MTGETQAHAMSERFAQANAYDAVGNRIKPETTNSAGTNHAVEFSFDQIDLLSEARLDGGAPIRLTHDALGQLTGEELAPDLKCEISYNADGLLTAQRTSASGKLLFATGYSYDKAGNLTRREDSQFGLDQYIYDPLGRRLYKETAGHKIWFGWDGDALAQDVIASQPREFVYRPESFEPQAMLGAPTSALLYINDPNGCPTRLIDTQGQIHWAASDATWGDITRFHAERVDNPIRLQGL